MRVPPVERRWGGPFNLLASDLWPGPDTSGQSIFYCAQGITEPRRSPLWSLRQFLGATEGRGWRMEDRGWRMALVVIRFTCIC